MFPWLGREGKERQKEEKERERKVYVIVQRYPALNSAEELLVTRSTQDEDLE